MGALRKHGGVTGHSIEKSRCILTRTSKLTEVQQLAEFVERADVTDMSADAVRQLKIRILDTLGVAIGALKAEPMIAIRKLIDDLGGAPKATLIGGGKTSPERAAFYNSALSRYLDFMDSYLAPGETNHPSDNFGAVLAAAEAREADGSSLLSPWQLPIRCIPGCQMSPRFGQKVLTTQPRAPMGSRRGIESVRFTSGAGRQCHSDRRHRK